MGFTIENISKKYEDNIILDDVSYTFDEGTIYGLVGYNGVGKSTLAKIMAGRVEADKGKIIINDKIESKWDIKEAMSSGVFHIDSYSTLLPKLSVDDNVIFSLNSSKDRSLIKDVLSIRKTIKKFHKLLQKYNIDLDTKIKSRELTFGLRYIVEILRASLNDPKFIIIDEIDNYLSASHKKVIKQIFDDLTKDGTTILYISHNLENVFNISSKILILADNKIAKVIDTDTNDTTGVVESVFKTLKEKPPRINVRPQETILEFQHVSNSVISDFNMYVREGEIVGILGLDSDGENSFNNILFSKTGLKKFRGEKIKVNSLQDLINSGIVFFNSSNLNDYLFHDSDLVFNMIPYEIKKKRYSNEKESEICEKYLQRLSIKANSSDRVKNISTGYQKKLLLVKSILSKGDVYIFVGLTDNIDIISKVDIYNIINELKRNGKGIILSSSNYDEIIGLSDIIYIVKDGKVKHRIDNHNKDEREILNKSILDNEII